MSFARTSACNAGPRRHHTENPTVSESEIQQDTQEGDSQVCASLLVLSSASSDSMPGTAQEGRLWVDSVLPGGLGRFE